MTEYVSKCVGCAFCEYFYKEGDDLPDYCYWKEPCEVIDGDNILKMRSKRNEEEK